MSVYDRIVELSRFDYANAFTCHDGIVRDQVARTYLDYPSAVYDEAYESGAQSHWPDSAALNIGNLGADVGSWILVLRPTFTFDNGGTGRSFKALYVQNSGTELTIGYNAFSSTRSWEATLRGSYTPASAISLKSVGSVTSSDQLQKVCVIVFTYDVAGEKNLYVDGDLLATDSTTVGSLSTSQAFNLGGTTGVYWAGGIFAAHRVNSILTPEQVRDISTSAFALFKDSEPLVYTAGGAGGAVLTGDALSITTANGSIITGVNLAGSATMQATASGDLSAAIKLNASALSVATASGDITAQIKLSGAAVVAAAASGTLTGGSSGLSGAAVANTTATGAIITQIPLAGNATAFASAAGGLTTIIQLNGAFASVNSLTGDLTVGVGLSASALASTLAAGTLTAKIVLNGAAISQAIASGALNTAGYSIPQTRVRVVSQQNRIRNVEPRFGMRQVTP